MVTPRPHAAQPSPAHAALLDALGGPKRVSEIVAERSGISLTSQSVSMWKSRGIPWRYRMPLVQEAHARGLDVPKDFLDLEGIKI